MVGKRVIGELILISASVVVVILFDGGVSFIQRPVPATYVALWVCWWLVTGQRQRGVSSTYDRNQGKIVRASGFVTIPVLAVAPPWEYSSFTGPIPRDGPSAWAGLAGFALGIALTWYAMRSLHGLFTTRLGVQPGHSLVTDGLYHWVRHPGYLGHILCLTGIGLALSSLISLALTVMLVPLILWRIRNEEEMLVKEFGEEYRPYIRRTRWRLIPRVY